MVAPPSFGKALQVLVVDADGGSAARLREVVLSACGANAQVDVALTAKDAEARLAGGGVDVCFADYALGQTVGFSFLANARAAYPQTAFILVADEARKEWVYSAIANGAQDCVPRDRLDHFEVLKAIAFALFHKSRELELGSAALRDSLTGLGNRALFQEQAAVLIEQARRNEERLAVLFMDVDGLKGVNDTFGHAAGDDLLRQAAARIRTGLRKSDVLARFGGDEFVAILPRIQSARTAPQVMQGLIDGMAATPFMIQGHTVPVGLSCGAAVYPDEARTIDELLAVSDARMYAAKARARSAKGTGAGKSMSWMS